jgi:hypothetical protein
MKDDYYIRLIDKKISKDIIKELKHSILSYPNDNCEW